MFSFFGRNKKTATGGQAGGRSGPPEPIPLMPFGPPANELEVALLAKYEKRMDVLAFLNLLLNSEVHVVTRMDQVVEVEGGFKFKDSPYLFTQVLRGQHHIGVFTNEVRGEVAPKVNPEFECSIPVKFRHLFPWFERNEVGVILNPFWEKNMSWDSAQLREIRSHVRVGGGP